MHDAGDSEHFQKTAAEGRCANLAFYREATVREEAVDVVALAFASFPDSRCNGVRAR